MQFATCMCQASRLGHACIQGLLLARVVIADERAAPAAHPAVTDAQEATGVVRPVRLAVKSKTTALMSFQTMVQ